jgi:PPOX class probable F420-dependent enzyme
MTSLTDVTTLIAAQKGLAIVSTLRADSSIQTSLVNAGVMDSPLSGAPSVAFVTYGRIKLSNLRARPQTAVAFRSGWQWAGVEGKATLVGPEDPQPGFDAERIRLLLREIFVSAGGTHDDWDEYDKVMLEQRRTAVFVSADRVYGNSPQ